MSGQAMNKMTRPVGTATYQDILDAPEDVTAEIIYGALQTHPKPAPRHAHVGSSLGHEIVGPFHKGRGGPGGWLILGEVEVQFGTDILVPDISGWRRERIPHLPETNWIETTPDWICEIHSPSTKKLDQIDKSEIYADFGVKHLWFVDPELRTLVAYENRDGMWTTIATLKDDDPVCVAPFDAITFALDDLWA